MGACQKYDARDELDFLHFASRQMYPKEGYTLLRVLSTKSTQQNLPAFVNNTTLYNYEKEPLL